MAVGGRLGLRGHDLEMLHFASLLHDIGKIGIPEQVLGKEGPLDELEAEVMKRHPAIGARILEKLDLLKDAAPIVLHHQERYDGDPDGDLSRLSRRAAPESASRSERASWPWSTPSTP